MWQSKDLTKEICYHGVFCYFGGSLLHDSEKSGSAQIGVCWGTPVTKRNREVQIFLPVFEFYFVSFCLFDLVLLLIPSPPLPDN